MPISVPEAKEIESAKLQGRIQRRLQELLDIRLRKRRTRRELSLWWLFAFMVAVLSVLAWQACCCCKRSRSDSDSTVEAEWRVMKTSLQEILDTFR